MEAEKFSGQDKKFMTLALQEAEQAFDAGDFPVGAVLAVDGKLVDQARNSIFSDARTIAHAEQKLISANSALLRHHIRWKNSYDVCLYTTLEPCLMCLGVAVMHRVSRIVCAAPDPYGGAAKIDPDELGGFYADHWPDIETGLLQEPSVNLIIKFLKTEKILSWRPMLTRFEKLQPG